MSVSEIETEVRQLSAAERAELLSRIVALDDDAWDRQIEDDVDSGRLDAFFEDAIKQYHAGLAKPL